MTKALLFDLDGTLIDSDPLHEAVFVEMMAEYGISVDAAFFAAHIHGRANKEIFADLLPDAPTDALDREKEARFRARLAREGAPVTPGAAALLDAAAAAGIPTALVTNAPAANVTASLAAIGLADHLPIRCLAEDSPRPKPAPDVYRRAAASLGVAPEDALAFEDSGTGIRAATGAGIPTIGLRSTLDEPQLRALGCAFSIADFTDPRLAPLIFPAP